MRDINLVRHNDDARIESARSFARRMSLLALQMAESTGKDGCHLGGSFSCLEILATLYGGEVLKYDASAPRREDRDRFIASKAHCVLSRYSALACAGLLDEESLSSFHMDGGLLTGHPWNIDLGIEFTGGSLGMGLSVGVGMALTAKRRRQHFTTYVLLGDGECNEGSVWEAFMAAAHFKLNNLVAIIDYNNMQFDGSNDSVMSISPLVKKLESFGWTVREVDGHSIEDLYDAFSTTHPDSPFALIARTIKAHGLPSLQDKAESHHAVLTQGDKEYMMRSIDGGIFDGDKQA